VKYALEELGKLGKVKAMPKSRYKIATPPKENLNKR